MPDVAVPAGTAVRRVLKGDKAVCVVPIEVRRDQNERDEHDDKCSPGAQSLPRLGREHRLTGHAEREIDHGVFGEQPRADGKPERRRQSHALALDQHGPEVERDRPEKEKRRVGGDRSGKKGNQRQRVEHDCRPKADARAIERPARQEHEPGRNRKEHRRKAADTGFAVTAKLCGAPDEPGEHRGLGEIAKIQLA